MKIRVTRLDTTSGGASISIFVETREGTEEAEYHEVSEDDYYWLCRSISKTIFKLLASEQPQKKPERDVKDCSCTQLSLGEIEISPTCYVHGKAPKRRTRK